MTDAAPLKTPERFNWFSAKVIALLLLALMTDSYDLQAASFAAPALMKVWGVPREAFSALFGAGLAGVFVGAPLFGWVGDRFGRKRAIVIACMFYGVFSLVCTAATEPTFFAVMRFLMGVGCGGALPNVVALATELAPSRRQGMLTSLIFVGMPLGGAIPGFVASELVPDFGWQMIFIIGGAAPILFAILIWLGLPESPAFLALRREPRPSARSAAAQRQLPTFFKLLSPRFLGTTLLLWLMFAGTLFTIYLVSQWLPTVLDEEGVSPSGVAIINLLYALGGALAGIALSLVIDRIGLASVAGLFVLAILSVLLVAYSEFSLGGLFFVMLFCGFAVTGVQYALNVSAGLIYPPEFRASGVGAALGIGRIGSVVGAMMGGLIVGGRDLFLVPVAPLALGTIATLVLMRWQDVRASARGAKPLS